VTLLDDVFALVRVASVSRDERVLADLVERRLRAVPGLDVTRIGDNVVARTMRGKETRLLVAGHLDTVPGSAADARLEGDVVRGVGACDMKATLAIMLDLASTPTDRSVDVTWVFYAREEIGRSESGLLEVAASRPDLLEATAAVLGEPTNAIVEAGCQGSLRVQLTLRGVRAHTARPFTGRNAIHRLGAVLQRLATYEPHQELVDGVLFTEQLQAVAVSGGVATNVVPDQASAVVNFRFSPRRSIEDATTWLRTFLDDTIEESDDFLVLDAAPAGAPSLQSPALARLVALVDGQVAGKVGWTDVATLQSFGVPAANFGAGSPLLAHHPDEQVTATEVERAHRVLASWLA